MPWKANCPGTHCLFQLATRKTEARERVRRRGHPFQLSARGPRCPLDIRPTCKFTVFLPTPPNPEPPSRFSFLFSPPASPYGFPATLGLGSSVRTSRRTASPNLANFRGNRDPPGPLRKRSGYAGELLETIDRAESRGAEFFKPPARSFDWSFCMCEGSFCTAAGADRHAGKGKLAAV